MHGSETTSNRASGAASERRVRSEQSCSGCPHAEYFATLTAGAAGSAGAERSYRRSRIDPTSRRRAVCRVPERHEAG